MPAALRNHKCHSKRQNTSRASRARILQLGVLDVQDSRFAGAQGNERFRGESELHHCEPSPKERTRYRCALCVEAYRDSPATNRSIDCGRGKCTTCSAWYVF